MRRCTRCGADKDEDEFWSDRRCPGGLACWCKDCWALFSSSAMEAMRKACSGCESKNVVRSKRPAKPSCAVEPNGTKRVATPVQPRRERRIIVRRVELDSGRIDQAIAVLTQCKRRETPWTDAWEQALDAVRDDPSDYFTLLWARPSIEAQYHGWPEPTPPYDPTIKYQLAGIAGV